MLSVEIGVASIEDVPALQQISIDTFTETFEATNSAENMQAYLQDSFNTARLTEELNTEGSSFYFAMDGDKVAGYLKINTGAAQTELKDADGLEVERIYVLKDYHGKQVGQLLYNTALQLAKDAGKRYLWLGVWEHNNRAIRFYQKNGFVAFDKHAFVLGDDVQTDVMMRLFL